MSRRVSLTKLRQRACSQEFLPPGLRRSDLKTFKHPPVVGHSPRRVSATALGAHFPSFPIIFSTLLLASIFSSILARFRRILAGQKGQKIEILSGFLGIIVETLFWVEFWWSFDKNDAEKHMDFQCMFNAFWMEFQF